MLLLESKLSEFLLECNLVYLKCKVVEAMLYYKKYHSIIKAEREGFSMKEKIRKKTNSALDYLGYALYAFAGLGIEILLMKIETNIYEQPYEMWSGIQNSIHWLITCFIWGSLGILLLKQLVPISKVCIQNINWIIVFTIFTISIAYTSFVWNGFKPMIELVNLGLGKFLIQYMYYAFESFLIVLIIAHGQKALDIWFGNAKSIPFGGMLLAATWGVIHILTQGTSTGMYTIIQALLYGVIYLLFHKNYKISYIAITFLFML